MIEPPIVKFSKWVSWSKRHDMLVEELLFPGVYLLARFKRAPKGHGNPTQKEIVYIGETCNNDLKGRLQQFDRSASKNKLAHSGGSSYHKKFNKPDSHLYLSIYPAKKVWTLNPLFIRHVEREIILKYALKYGKQPELNKK